MRQAARPVRPTLRSCSSPHLLPDRCEASSRRSTSRFAPASRPADVAAAYARYAGHAVRLRPPRGRAAGPEGVVGTPRAEIGCSSCPAAGGRRRLRDRQPPEGRGVAGRPEHEPDVRVPGDGGTRIEREPPRPADRRQARRQPARGRPAPRAHALAAIAASWTAGEHVVVVHGGGKRIDASLQAARRFRRRRTGACGSRTPRRWKSSSSVLVGPREQVARRRAARRSASRPRASPAPTARRSWAEFHPPPRRRGLRLRRARHVLGPAPHPGDPRRRAAARSWRPSRSGAKGRS